MTIQPSLSEEDYAREGIRPLVSGVTRGAFDVATDEDYFVFAPEPGRQYRVMVDSSVDTELGFYDPATGELLNADPGDSGPGLNDEVVFTTPNLPTSVIVQVDAFGNGEPGDADAEAIRAAYEVLVFDLGPAADVPARDPAVDAVAGSLEQASGLGLFQVVQEGIEFDGDIDTYRVYLERGTTYAFSLEGSEGLDPFVELIGPDGTLLARNDNRQEGTTDAGIVASVDRSGFHFVSASASDQADGTGRYELEVLELEPAPLPLTEDVIGDTIADASLGEASQPVATRIQDEQDLDVYRYVLVGGNDYRIDVASRLGEVDPVVGLFDAQATLIAEDDNGGGGLDARLNFTPDETSEFFIAVAGRPGTAEEGEDAPANGYEITVSITDSAPATTLEAQEIALLYEAGLDRDGEIDFAGLDFWIEVFERGRSIEFIADKFIESDEFQENAEAFLGDGTDIDDGNVRDPAVFGDDAFVTFLYDNVLGREFDQDGFDFWLGFLQKSKNDRADLLVEFARSPENVGNSPFVFDLEPVGDVDGDGDRDWDFVTEA